MDIYFVIEQDTITPQINQGNIPYQIAPFGVVILFAKRKMIALFNAFYMRKIDIQPDKSDYFIMTQKPKIFEMNKQIIN